MANLPGAFKASEVLKAQDTADLSGSPLTAIDDQIFPTNLADIVTDGTFCVRNTPADVAAFGLGDHVDGDILKKVGAAWKRLLRPVAGSTIVWQTVFGKAAVFVDEPVAGNLPLFANTLDTGEAFSVPYIGTDLPGQISFDGTLLIGNTAGGLTTANFGNAAVLLLLGTLAVWIRDTVNPERSGAYNLIVNDAGTGVYTLRRDYNFRDSSSFTDGQTFFVGSGSGGDEANKNYLILLTQQFILNTTSLAIVEGTITNLTLNQGPLGSEPGSINYDPVKGTMNVRNIFPGSSIQVGQESVVFVVNNTGATIPDGKVINISGYDATNDAMEIVLALADTVENTEVLGITTTTMVNGALGLVTIFGRVNDLDTTSFTEGVIVFLSDTVAGDLTTTKPAVPIQMGHVGKVNASTGFIQVEIRELEKSIYGGFFHSLDQTFIAGISAPIKFNNHAEISGIDHSTTVNNDEFTFTSGGVYQATAEPQYTRTTGGGTDVLNMFLAKDTGSGFVNVADSNVKFSVNTAGVTTVSPLTATFRVNATDKIRFMAQVEDVNLILNAFAASGTSPNDIPLTPSIIMNIVRIGD